MTIWKLQAAELKRERRELETGFEDGPNTLEAKYLKTKQVRFGGLALYLASRNIPQLLRSFRAVIEEIVLEEPGDEQKYPDCAICYEELSKDTAAAYVSSLLISGPISDQPPPAIHARGGRGGNGGGA
jgi:hypothetical protein